MLGEEGVADFCSNYHINAPIFEVKVFRSSRSFFLSFGREAGRGERVVAPVSGPAYA